MGKKKAVIIVSGIALVAVIALVLFLTVFKKDAYRILKVFEFAGKGSVTRQDIGDIEPYSNMVLETGDTVALDEGEMVLLADEDKYIHLEEGTELVLNAAGSSESSKTTIELKSGAITNDIQNKLSEGSYYEVNTPNSTMSVRGTIFRVEVYEENGIKYTRVSVFEGKVASRLVYKNGDVADNEVSIEKGKEVLIYEDDKTVDYVSPPKDIDYSDLPDSVKEILKNALEDGRDLDILLRAGDNVHFSSPDLCDQRTGSHTIPYSLTLGFFMYLDDLPKPERLGRLRANELIPGDADAGREPVFTLKDRLAALNAGDGVLVSLTGRNIAADDVLTKQRPD